MEMIFSNIQESVIHKLQTFMQTYKINLYQSHMLQSKRTKLLGMTND